MPVAKRILILGPSGAGKSTLARRIGTRLALFACGVAFDAELRART